MARDPDGDTEIIGGPLGRHARTGPPYRTWWTPLRVLLAALFVASSLSLITFSHCRNNDWTAPDMYVHVCYSEPAVMFVSQGLDQHRNPFAAFDKQGPMNYPILANATAYLVSWLVPSGTAAERRLIYFDYFALLSILSWAAVTILVSRFITPWRNALLVALAPAGILVFFTSWDAVTALLVMLSFLALKRGSPILSGVLLGVAVLFSLYPVILLFGYYLGLRALRVREFDRLAAAAIGTWTAITAIVQFTQPGAAFTAFVDFFSGGAGYGSLWFVTQTFGLGTISNINFVWLLSLIVGGVALVLVIRRRGALPSVGQGLFISVLLFFLFSKDYSPQYILVLIPLAVLAQISWRDFLLWQSIEVIYAVLLWQYVASVTNAPKGLPANAYAWIVVLHLAGIVYLIVKTVTAMPVVPATEIEKQYQK